MSSRGNPGPLARPYSILCAQALPLTDRPCLRSAPRGRLVFLAAFAAALGPLSFGFALGYSSPAIPSLRRAAPPAPHLDEDAASWFGVRPWAHPPALRGLPPPTPKTGAGTLPALPGFGRTWRPSAEYVLAPLRGVAHLPCPLSG